jgi:hypothetical protein
MNPDLSKAESLPDLITAVGTGCERANKFWENALQIPGFDEEVSKILARLFLAKSKSHDDWPPASKYGTQPATFGHYSAAKDAVFAFCRRVAYGLDPSTY